MLIVLGLRKSSDNFKTVFPHHLVHDLATWNLAWSCFCAYIGFSQYMLLYYANIPEGTYAIMTRTQNGFGLQLIIEALIRWPLPFLVLMSQSRRTCPKTLVIVLSLVLFGNFLDWSWIVVPAFVKDQYSWPISEFFMTLGFAGVTLLLALRFWAKHGILPKNEPKVLQAINSEHLH